MRNPLRKRYIRELKSDMGKYIAIALFMIMLIGLVSGYLVAAGSIERTFYEGWERYNIEDGHMTFSIEPDKEVLEEIEKEAGLSFYSLAYMEEDIDKDGTTLRIFSDRTEVDGECLMDGAMPSKKDEIAIDRIFAKNNGISIGDSISVNHKEIKVSGIVALVDYNCLFENNNDMMFNASNFGVGVMTEDGYRAMESDHIFFNYAWKYDKTPEDKQEENTRSEELIEVLEEILTDYNTKRVLAGDTELLQIDSYVPKYQNKSITYCMDDMAGDKPMFILFDYIVVVILAFVFAVTISSTIQKEAAVIGTLRASGYSKAELVRHYLFMPMLVTLIASAIGNILGYTVFVNMMKGVFYQSFSLATYESVFNLEAFCYTTVIPLMLMLAINLYILVRKLAISPIRFLRRDLSKKKKKRAVLLNKKLPFVIRFRLRILFQNMSSYIVLSIGIFFGGVIAIFGFMFGPLLSDYADLIVAEKICDYQYVLMAPADTDTEGVEKYCISGLEATIEGYLKDEISVYGIEENSAYITKEIPKGKVLVSEGLLKKYKLNPGDTITLKETYEDKKYDFVIADTYAYSASLAVFMNKEEFNERFDKEKDYYSGYFSNQEIRDIDSKQIVTVITQSDLTKVSDQMQNSMGEFMSLFKYFGAIMLVLLMYLMTKQVIEKNAQSIAMTKILGFRNGEIARLYLLMTGIVVFVALLVTMPLTDIVLRWMFENYLYRELSGYIPYIISKQCYVYTFLIGAGCFLAVAAVMFLKIGKIRKSEALKNVE